MITYSLRGEPVARQGVSAMSDEARLMSEVFERLIEIEEIKRGRGVALVQRLSTVAQLSTSAYRTVLHVGCGQVHAVVASYEEQARNRGLTRQALHWQWSQDMRAIRQVFPALAVMLQDLRDSVAHHEDAVSPADALRSSTDRDNGGES